VSNSLNEALAFFNTLKIEHPRLQVRLSFEDKFLLTCLGSIKTVDELAGLSFADKDLTLLVDLREGEFSASLDIDEIADDDAVGAADIEGVAQVSFRSGLLLRVDVVRRRTGK
jgi:hypothetical protein